MTGMRPKPDAYTLSGVVFVLRRAPKLVSVKAELASIIQLNRPNALPPLRSVELEVCLPEWESRPIDR